MIRYSKALSVLGFASLTTACMTEPPSPPAPPPLVSRACDAGPVQQYVGQSFATFTLSDVQIQSKSANARVIAPGTAVTSEFRADRVNVYVDQGNVVTRIVCG